MNKKLLFIHDGPVFYDENGDYYEYAFHNLYERYSYLADEITFLVRTQKKKNNDNYDRVPSEIRVESIPNIKSVKLFFVNRRKAKHKIKDEVDKCDMVILRGSTTANLAFNYLKKSKKPFIFECVGCHFDGFWNHGIVGKFVAPFAFLRNRYIIRNSKYVYYVTSEFLQKRYPTNGRSVGCSDAIVETNEDILQKRLNRIIDKDYSSGLILGTAAAIDVRYKGQEYVIRAIKKLKKNGIHVEYWLAGGNRHNSSYLYNLADKEGVLDQVKFLGNLDGNEIIQFYDSLDIYVQPSLQEGLPRSVVEAMSRACPSIGSTTGGIPELLEKKYIFNRKDINGICKVVQEINKKGKDELEKMAHYSFEKSKEYSNKINTEKRIELYQDFLNNNFK